MCVIGEDEDDYGLFPCFWYGVRVECGVKEMIEGEMKDNGFCFVFIYRGMVLMWVNKDVDEKMQGLKMKVGDDGNRWLGFEGAGVWEMN